MGQIRGAPRLIQPFHYGYTGERLAMLIAPIDQRRLPYTLDRVLQAGLIAITALALVAMIATRAQVPAWAKMWIVASVLFVICKWLTWSRRSARYSNVSAGKRLAYLFGKPGSSAGPRNLPVSLPQTGDP